MKIDNQSVGMAPSQFYLQAGDTIKVTFPMKCECVNIKKIAKWLEDSLDVIHSIKAASSDDEVKDCPAKTGILYPIMAVHNV